MGVYSWSPLCLLLVSSLSPLCHKTPCNARGHSRKYRRHENIEQGLSDHLGSIHPSTLEEGSVALSGGAPRALALVHALAVAALGSALYGALHELTHAIAAS